MLYMANNFILYPSFYAYVEKLNLDSAYCGLILSIEHFTCLFNPLIYDRFKTFKNAFIVSILLILISNMFYILIFALQFDSYVFLLISRVFVGLGNFKGMNRKYLKQYTPFYLITIYANSYFLFYVSGIVLGKLLLMINLIRIITCIC